MNRYLFVPLLLISAHIFAQHVPTFEEVISLRSVGGVALSDDGKHVAYALQTTDWNENRFDSEIWLSKNGATPFQLTNTPKSSSSSAAFSPDGKWIAFLADRGNKNQIQVISIEGGEAKAVTNEEEGVSSFEWYPSGTKFIFLKPEKEDKNKKEQEKRYGGFEVDDKEFTLAHLWQVDFNPFMPDPTELPCYEKIDSLKAKAGCIELAKAKKITDGKFTVTSFIVSPDGKSIAFGHQPNPLINSFIKADISIVNLTDNKIVALVTNPSSDGLEDWSPDSKEVLFTSNLSDTLSNFYKNSQLFVISVVTKATRQLAKSLDEDLSGFVWEQTGVYASIWNKTKRPLYRIDAKTGTHSIFKDSPSQIFGFSF
jgi:dipeptidyl aminopeptidase/acylaminoacyl peptidase